MTLVSQRYDFLSDFWKERFIAGLPPLFAEKIRTRLRDQHNGIILYHTYTFGKLINENVSKGLDLCNDINLKFQLKK